MPYQQLHSRIDGSEHRNWQLYLLIIASIVCAVTILPIPILLVPIEMFEHLVAPYSWLVILGVQGVVIGFAAELIYEHGDGYAKIGPSNEFATKDLVFLIRILMMTVVAAIVNYVAPALLRAYAQYLVIQSVGVVILGTMLLIHRASSEWDESKEWPALVGGAMLAIGPSVPVLV